jgi:hypothetical protein
MQGSAIERSRLSHRGNEEKTSCAYNNNQLSDKQGFEMQAKVGQDEGSSEGEKTS